MNPQPPAAPMPVEPPPPNVNQAPPLGQGQQWQDLMLNPAGLAAPDSDSSPKV